MFENRQGGKKNPTFFRWRRGLLQGHHEYEHWLHHAIITKLLTAPRRMRGPDSTHLSRSPLCPAGLTLSIYESCSAKYHLTMTPISVTWDQGGCWEKEQRVCVGMCLVFCQQWWFEAVFGNELWVCEMCHGNICIHRFTTFEYFGLQSRFFQRPCTDVWTENTKLFQFT